VLSFSRASWFGAAVMLAAGGWVFWRYGGETRNRWRYWRALAVLGAAGLVAVLPVLPLLVVRSDLSTQKMSTEVRSVQQREQYAGASLRMLAAHPVLGTGAGTFVVVVKALVPAGTSAEPVHNLLLLIAAETGLVGGLAAACLVLAIAWRAWQRRRQASTAEIIWGLVLLGLLVTGLFDHYWWTQPPARLAFATVLGLWAGQG
jgi:O-antigen ligase